MSYTLAEQQQPTTIMYGRGDHLEPELAKLKAAADRVALAAGRIDGFLYRFSGPSNNESAIASPQPPESYRNDLATLFDQIARLEDAVSALDAIG